MEDGIVGPEKEISGHTVKVRPFVGSRSNKMMVRLQQCFEPPHSIICTPDAWQQFCIEFLAFTFYDGKELGKLTVFDEVFAGHIALLFDIILFTSEVNFGKDFFSQGGNSGDISQDSPPTKAE